MDTLCCVVKWVHTRSLQWAHGSACGATVRDAIGWYAYSVLTVVPTGGKLPCASGAYSTEAPGRTCQLS